MDDGDCALDAAGRIKQFCTILAVCAVRAETKSGIGKAGSSRPGAKDCGDSTGMSLGTQPDSRATPS